MASAQNPNQWTGPRKVMRERLSQQISPKQLAAIDRLCIAAPDAGARIRATECALIIEVPTASGGAVSVAWICLPDGPWRAQGTAAVFGSHFTSERTRRGGQVGEILEGWVANFRACSFAHRPPGWKPRIVPSDRWQVEYSDLPDNLETIEGWMVDKIAKLRDA